MDSQRPKHDSQRERDRLNVEPRFRDPFDRKMKEIDRRVEMMREQEAALCSELHDAGVAGAGGIPLESVWSFFDAVAASGEKRPSATLHDRAIEILSRHFTKGSYYVHVREGLIRALTGKYGYGVFDYALTEFKRLLLKPEVDKDVSASMDMLIQSSVHEDPASSRALAESHVQCFREALGHFLGTQCSKEDVTDLLGLLPQGAGDDAVHFLATDLRTKLKRWRMNESPEMATVAEYLDSF